MLRPSRVTHRRTHNGRHTLTRTSNDSYSDTNSKVWRQELASAFVMLWNRWNYTYGENDKTIRFTYNLFSELAIRRWRPKGPAVGNSVTYLEPFDWLCEGPASNFNIAVTLILVVWICFAYTHTHKKLAYSHGTSPTSIQSPSPSS